MGFNRQIVVDLALSQVGYHEKKSNASLDDPKANSGSGNFTKYARDLDANPTFYNGRKNGYAWCDVFVDWCFYTAYGDEPARILLCQPDRSAGAGCTYSMNYYKARNQFHRTNPQVGDQIFFGSGSESTHTGIVYDVSNTTVYTVEGNTSDQVAKRSYALNNSRIMGYGRPEFMDDYVPVERIEDPAPAPGISQGSTATVKPVVVKNYIDTVQEVQEWLNTTYSSNLEVNGEYGSETKQALVKALQKHLGLNPSGVFGMEELILCSRLNLKYNSKNNAVKILQAFLVCYGYSDAYIDGEFGKDTRKALLDFQKKNKLSVDGIAAQEVFYFLCK